jgi:putative transposase
VRDRNVSDLTNQERSLITPHIPPLKTSGRPRETSMRDVVDAILYIASIGCAWRMLPNDFPPISTVRYYFYDWRDNGIFENISHLLVVTARVLLGRKPGPTAGIADNQSIKTTESGGISGYDAGKRINGRDGAALVLKSVGRSHPELRHIFADGGYTGPKLRSALADLGKWTYRSSNVRSLLKASKSFRDGGLLSAPLHGPTVAKDWDKSIESSTAWMLIAHIRTLTRRIVRL